MKKFSLLLFLFCFTFPIYAQNTLISSNKAIEIAKESIAAMGLSLEVDRCSVEFENNEWIIFFPNKTPVVLNYAGRTVSGNYVSRVVYVSKDGGTVRVFPPEWD